MSGTPSVSMTLESISGVRLGGLSYGNLQPPSRPGDVWMLPETAANRIAAFPFVRSVSFAVAVRLFAYHGDCNVFVPDDAVQRSSCL